MNVINREVDMAGKWRVTVLLDDGNTTMLKYDKPQTDKAVLTKVAADLVTQAAVAKAASDKMTVTVQSGGVIEVKEFATTPTDAVLRTAVSESFTKVMEAKPVTEEVAPVAEG
jgi:hypothetical protein